jgi:hypothetical protein
MDGLGKITCAIIIIRRIFQFYWIEGSVIYCVLCDI